MSSFRPRQRSAKSYDLLPPERPRAASPFDRVARPAEVEDAEFTVIAGPRSGRRASQPAFSVVPPENDNAAPKRPARRRTAAPVPTVPSGRFLESGERWLNRLSDNMFSALVAIVFLVVFGAVGGFSALAMMGDGGSQTARVDITHVSALTKTVNGLPMLVISGIIENHGEGPLSSPRLKAEIYSGGQVVASTLFRTRSGPIAVGESRGFQAKLPQAGGKSPEVRVFLAE